MKKWYFLAGILVVSSVYHSVFDDIQQRMIDTFSKAKVGEIYNLSDFTNNSFYEFVGIDYIDFRQPMDINNGMEKIIIWHHHQKAKIFYSCIQDIGELCPSQVFLDEKIDSRKIPYGYRCPLNAKIQLVQREPESQIYDIKPLNCQPLAE